MSVQDDLRFEKEGAVAWITVNRPELRNAFTFEMYQRLSELADVIDGDDEIRVAVFRGAGGKSFAAGTDIRQFLEFTEPHHGIDYEQKMMGRNLGRVRRITKPTVAAIDGFCVGGGLALALACDLRYATGRSRFGAPPARLGNIMSLPTTFRMLMLLGEARTLEMLYTARLISAQEAAAVGLINAALEPEKFEQHVRETLEQICLRAPLTQKHTKAEVLRILDGLAPSWRGEEYVQACYMSEDFKEGVHAFLEKRPPVWKGR